MTESFFAYVRRRRTLMAVSGAVAFVGGVVAAVAIGSGPGPIVLSALAISGLFVALGSRAGSPLIDQAPSLLRTPSTKVELTTWPYRTIRSPVTNRVLVTLDLPGSTDRTPLAEFKPVWYSPGGANAPTCEADVYGTIGPGDTVLAVTEEGNCYLGRVLRTRPAH